jgi:hypothetical protein
MWQHLGGLMTYGGQDLSAMMRWHPRMTQRAFLWVCYWKQKEAKVADDAAKAPGGV